MDISGTFVLFLYIPSLSSPEFLRKYFSVNSVFIILRSILLAITFAMKNNLPINKKFKLIINPASVNDAITKYISPANGVFWNHSYVSVGDCPYNLYRFLSAKSDSLPVTNAANGIGATKDVVNASIKFQEEERQRIAADLHDDAGPLLAAARLYMTENMVNLDRATSSIRYSVPRK